MATITPINRHTEYVVEDDGTKAYKVYNNASPHYYMDKTGSLNPIDITNLQTITKDSVGEIKLREKNIASVGLRTDGNKTKYLGIRPDETQEDGTEQLEWVILDYFDIVIHIFNKEKRAFYKLEELWEDAKLTVY